MLSVVTEELIARQSPEAQAIIRLLLAEIQELKSQVVELQSQLLKLTPQNSSLPPSSQHPHAKPIPPKSKSSRKRGGQPSATLQTERAVAQQPKKQKASRASSSPPVLTHSPLPATIRRPDGRLMVLQSRR